MLNLGTKLLLLGLLLISSVAAASGQLAPSRQRPPTASITLTVNESASDKLVQQVKKFAEAGSFALQMANLPNYPQHVYVELWRADLNIIVVNILNNATDFSIFIYQTNNAPLPPEYIDTVVSSLTDAIVNIQGVAVNTIRK